ncbi:hypothetical protein [Arthrobacter sp. MYb213]|uniref:hypothetical protein n=1 Tax=Arthrobacter sp. MYb213 TaxID=1848595 RepID=UPI000CFDFFAE|nr:hypothetical protein [Arthrobacter sp. MYb213]PRB66530.1 hypothetical protein CQ011_17595 [Arthrobacter sp. MYb213]
MSPRPGGEADKLGNKYEAAWAVRHALYCIFDGRNSMTLEDVDIEVGKGSEFTFESGTSTEVHQLKRQNGNSNSWTVKSLADLKVFDAAAAHVAAGREFHFVSLVPCRPLQELTERARKSSDVTSFTQSWLTGELRPFFDQLSAADILGSPQKAWDTLRGMRFSVQDEHDIIRMNAMLAGRQLSGTTGHLIAIAIGDILLDNLGRRLTRTEILELLAEHDIRLLEAASHQGAHEQVHALTNSWRESIRRELLQPRIERAEATKLIDVLRDHRMSFVAGKAGGGKSSVLEQSVESLEATGAEVLAIRLDRLDSFASTTDLGRQLGLETSPAVVLALAAENRDAFLIIDQLDAVSLASGRMPDSFNIVMDLIGEALSVSGINVILACREFDIDNDHRIRSLTDRPDTVKVSVGPLSDEVVNDAVTQMNLDATCLTASQRAILRTPMHLVLLKTIAGQVGALAFQSRGSLFEAYWERKRQSARARRDGVRFNEVLSRVANAVSDRQTLSIPVEILDDGDLIEDANVLVSEHVLARDGNRIAFFHETFFDYAFARQWVSRSESLVDFLLRDEQELFRRAQVRQILQHLYEREPERFQTEASAVLMSEQVRFHIKATVLAVISNLDAPTSEDAEVVLDVAATAPPFEEQLWLHTRRAPWFKRFYEDGTITAWLDSGESALQQRAVNLMMSAIKEQPGEVAELLHARQAAPEYLNWLRWIARSSDAHQNRLLFDLVLAAVREGGFDAAEHELWLAVHDLAKHKPLWAIELIQARVVDHTEGLLLDESGKVALLKLREYGATKLVREAAAAQPLAFVRAVVPYLLQVMAATAYEPRPDNPIRDRHFSARFDADDLSDRELGDALLTGSVRALEALARTSPQEVRPLLEEVAADPHDSAQFLLYRAITAGATSFADWAATLILEGDARLNCGYVSDSDWAARELVQAVAPHLCDKVHRALEDQFRDLRNAHESRHSFGRSAFTFLSALEEHRLSPDGVRRLGEYRRKFKEEAPPKPRGFISGTIGSPIESQAASKMTDEQWLKAMTKHNSDETNWGTFTGGARELSHVLREQAAANPSRFARLAIKLTPEYNAAYADGLLMGFADADRSDEAAPLIYDAVRHIASLGHDDVDRWLGNSLRRYYRDVPLDLVELLRDRALQSSDPKDDSPIFTSEGGDGRSAADMHNSGINTARGSLAETLGDLLIYDADGARTELVRPHLDALASDPVLFVRSCAAHTVAASLRHARPDAVAAFEKLIDADDRILAASMVQQLMLYIGNVDPEIITPVIQRMLESQDAEAREAGGSLAAFAALEWSRPELMTHVLTGDAMTRKGAAEICANRVDRTSNAELASSTLITLMHDDDDEVLEAAAKVAPHLRDHPLGPFANLLTALIDSPAYDYATPQLLLTLQHAPDKIDALVLKASQRFISVFGSEAGDIRTSAAGDAHYISELVVRGLAQSRNKRHRAALLDVLDTLLELGVYGVDDAIAESERI